ncbi:MAG: hypothetical protein RJA70_4274 [Pseudomonadota bacterium]
MPRATHAHKPVDVEKLERSLLWALKHGLPAGELVAMLRPLVRHTDETSARGLLARLQLGEQLLVCPAQSPQRFTAAQCAWEAAGWLRKILTQLNLQGELNYGSSPRTSELRARGEAAFGMACSILGHYRAAKRAYLRGLREDPENAVAAHNLGHLLATQLRAPAASLVWLQKAHVALPGNPEVAASLAHALVQLGQCDRAVALLTRALGSPADANRWVQRWRSSGAPTPERAAAGE